MQEYRWEYHMYKNYFIIHSTWQNVQQLHASHTEMKHRIEQTIEKHGKKHSTWIYKQKLIAVISVPMDEGLYGQVQWKCLFVVCSCYYWFILLIAYQSNPDSQGRSQKFVFFLGGI